MRFKRVQCVECLESYVTYYTHEVISSYSTVIRDCYALNCAPNLPSSYI